MTTETRSEPPVDALERVLSATDGADEQSRYLLNPTRSYVFALASTDETASLSRPLRVLGRRAVLRELRQDFLMGSRTANLVDAGAVSLREAELDHETPAVVAPDGVHALVSVEDTAGSLPTNHPEFESDARTACAELWETADQYPLRTPALSSLRRSMTDDLGQEFRDGFETALEVAASLRDRTAFHEVRAALAVAAERELLHYDVSRWGEDSGLASTASFSRHKTDLEAEGVIETEKEPVQMGRPRQRLLLTDEYRAVVEEEGLAGLVSRVME
ncbi:DUF5821 family protein [Halobaculum sp. MBLA0143]|uniref:transcriptional regulator TbsP domain-containing protein n=1 Tax=Halobaculum sp. MBLA0143 TaxID=3079933 RepID=UPI0035242F19